MALTKIDDRGLKTPIDLLDNEKIRLGTGNDIELYHDGSNSIIHNKTGQTWIQGSELYLSSNHVDGQEKYLKATANGAVELYHNNTKRFETTSDGVQIYGLDNGESGARGDFKFKQVDGTSKIMFDASTAQLEFLDNSKATFGTADDLKIYHDGSNSYMGNSTGYLYLKSDYLALRSASSENYIIAESNGAVQLYYDNSKKLETTTDGVQVTGEVVSGTLHCSGKLDMPDSTGATVGRVLLGDGDDLQIYHDGSNSRSRIQHNTDFPLQILQSGNAGMLIQNQNSYNIEIKTNAEDAIKCVANGAVELYHDNTKKFETTANGVTVDGSNSISMDGNANGQLQVIGSGYTGAIALNSSAMHIYHNSDARDLVFGINETERLRLTTGGELKFATGSRSGNVNSICAANGNSIDLNGSEYMYFRTGNTERARITSAGHFLVHATSDSSSSDTGFKILDWGGSGTWVAHVYNSGYPANTPGPHLYNLHSNYSGVRFYPRVDGGLANYQSNNANLCDERAKTDIVDLGDQWSTVKQWKVRKFRYKKDPSDTPLKVGVIAQQIENVSPDLVEEDWPYEGEPNNPTTLYKTVKEEQMFMIAMKALQEAMAKIETLETKVAALEAA